MKAKHVDAAPGTDVGLTCIAVDATIVTGVG